MNERQTNVKRPLKLVAPVHQVIRCGQDHQSVLCMSFLARIPLHRPVAEAKEMILCLALPLIGYLRLGIYKEINRANTYMNPVI